MILVDTNDNPIGVMSKMETHQKGLLHRAFSIFVFNKKGELLLQQRAEVKYHSPLLWTNTCCSHPRIGEKTIEAAHRRLVEEMGFDCSLAEKFSFIYKSKLENNLWEHEYDHVFVGNYNKTPEVNPDEVNDYKWVDMNFLKSDIIQNKQNYTIWFRIIFEKYLSKL